MFGPAKNVAGQCNARLTIGDDYGDNHATMRCQLAPGHEGKHRENYQSRISGQVTIEWEHDDKVAHGEPVDVEDLLQPIGDDELDVVRAAPAYGGPPVPVESEEFTLTLMVAPTGSTKLDVIRLFRDVLGTGLTESKRFVEAAPVVIKDHLTRHDAIDLKRRFEECGASVYMEARNT